MRVAIVTLGCDKNTVDNEYLAGMLEEAGCEVTVEVNGQPLDAAVVTTCGFIDAAKRQSIETIQALAESKRARGSPRRLFVAGCLAQRISDQIMDQIPEIDGIVGVGQFRDLTRMIVESEATGNGDGERRINVAPVPTVDIYPHLKRKSLDNQPHAFLKVSDGCNHACSFCAIPSMKGKLRSVEPSILLAEAREMIGRGVKEICLVAQDLSDYGRDFKGGARARPYRLPELLRDLCAIEGDFWIRCLYYYPGQVTDRFLETMATEPKIVPYLEMPFQHLHPEVLRRMKRPFHEVNTFDAVGRIRKAVPGIALRTTFIVGFPGESQKQFQFLLDGVKRLRFDRMGAFEYSPEDGTPAGAMDGQIPAKTRTQRWRMVMARQAKISGGLNRKRKNKIERVLVEHFDEEHGHWIARGTRDAPHVDANVLIEPHPSIEAGKFARVKVIKTGSYDVLARCRV